MQLIQGINIENFTTNKRHLAFINFGMKQFKKVEGMDALLQNIGPEPLIEFLLRIAKLYDVSIAEVNSHSVRQELFHFVGNRVEHLPEIDEAVDLWLKFVEKHCGEGPEPVKKKKKKKKHSEAS